MSTFSASLCVFRLDVPHRGQRVRREPRARVARWVRAARRGRLQAALRQRRCLSLNQRILQNSHISVQFTHVICGISGQNGHSRFCVNSDTCSPIHSISFYPWLLLSYLTKYPIPLLYFTLLLTLYFNLYCKPSAGVTDPMIRIRMRVLFSLSLAYWLRQICCSNELWPLTCKFFSRCNTLIVYQGSSFVSYYEYSLTHNCNYKCCINTQSRQST